MCDQLRRGEIPAWKDAREPRIRAAVIADPLNFFDAAGLKATRIPIQLWASESGGDGVQRADMEKLRGDLPVPPEFHEAQGAAHFAFLAPCSAAQAEALPVICRDTEGFDRVRFHAALNAKVLAFFRQRLSR